MISSRLLWLHFLTESLNLADQQNSFLTAKIPALWMTWNQVLILSTISSISPSLLKINCIGQEYWHQIAVCFGGKCDILFVIICSLGQIFFIDIYFRTPYYSRKLCDGSYARADIQKKIKELYVESLTTDGEDFIAAVAEHVSDMYDFQRITKRISSGMKDWFLCHIDVGDRFWREIMFVFRVNRICHPLCEIDL